MNALPSRRSYRKPSVSTNSSSCFNVRNDLGGLHDTKDANAVDLEVVGFPQFVGLIKADKITKPVA
ncbi:hypothetical protein ACTG9Q_28225 [Actinokineospora sp. 24-640]